MQHILARNSRVPPQHVAHSSEEKVFLSRGENPAKIPGVPPPCKHLTSSESTIKAVKKCEICSKLTGDTRTKSVVSGVFIGNFDHIAHLFTCLYIVEFEHVFVC